MGHKREQTKPIETQAAEEEPDDEYDGLPELSEKRDETVIAEGIKISGTLHGDGVIRVEGELEGAIKLTGAVIVTATGVVKGPIQADVIGVAGNVEGDVVARDHLRLEMTGYIGGDVSTSSFVIKDGGCLNGRCTMTNAEQEPTFVY